MLLPDIIFFRVYTPLLLFFILVVFLKPKFKKEILYTLLMLIITVTSMRYMYFELDDVQTYLKDFYSKAGYEDVHSVWHSRDLLYHYLTQLTALTKSPFIHFLIVELIVVLPVFFWAKTIAKKYKWWILSVFLAFPFFIAYAVNGMRFGMAFSLYLWGTSFYNQKRWRFYLLSLFAVLFHATLILPIVLWLFIKLLKKWSIELWVTISGAFLSIAIFFKHTWYQPLLTLFPEKYFYRLHFYLDESLGNPEVYTFGNFRWDFLMFSLFFAGLFYSIGRWRKIENNYWEMLMKLYIITIGVTFLFSYAHFFNRFISLAWMLIPALMVLTVLEGFKSEKRKTPIMLGVSVLQLLVLVFIYYL